MPHYFQPRPPTMKQYTETHRIWTEELRKNAERIADSSECRKYLVKNAESAPMDELLIRAVECIYDLTGDSQFRDQVIRQIEGRKHG